MADRFRAGSLATLVKLLERDRLGLMITPGEGDWEIGLMARGGRGVFCFATESSLAGAVDSALARVRRGEHLEAMEVRL